MTRLHWPHEIVGCTHISSTLLVFEQSVEYSIQDEAMDVARSAPQEAHYQAEIIYVGTKEVAGGV